MESGYEPFKLVEEDGRTILRLHGTEEQRAKVEADKVYIIMDAIAKGWDVDIKYSIIEGDLDIEIAAGRLREDGSSKPLIKGSVAIRFSRIEGYVSFTHAIFNADVSFRGVVVHRDAIFCEVTYRGHVDFTDATFLSIATFTPSFFQVGASFFHVTFEDDAFFNGATFMGGVEFSSAVFSRRVEFESATFTDYICFRDTAARTPIKFAEVNFRGNTVYRGLWNHILCPVIYLLTIGRAELKKKTVTQFLDINTARLIDESSNPCLKRYIEDEQWLASWGELGLAHKVIFPVWELTSHCGRSFVLWMFWVLLAAILFGAVYADYTVPTWLPEFVQDFLVRIDPKMDISPIRRIPTRFTPYYFSIVTFTTLGLGDVTPLNLAGEVWLAIEVVLGYIMLGGLISIFANKLARRS